MKPETAKLTMDLMTTGGIKTWGEKQEQFLEKRNTFA